jgi:ankyrin repeat protein
MTSLDCSPAEQQERFRNKIKSIIRSTPDLTFEVRSGLELCIQGNDVNFQNSWGFSSLLIACAYDHLRIVRELLKHDGVNVNIRDSSVGSTPLIIACAKGNLDIIRELLKHKDM